MNILPSVANRVPILHESIKYKEENQKLQVAVEYRNLQDKLSTNQHKTS